MPTINKPTFAVLGAGSWGTALATLLAENQFPVNLWSYKPHHIRAMQSDGQNSQYLAGIRFPDCLFPQQSMQQAVQSAQTILVVVPSFAFRQTLELLKPLLNPQQKILWATKGLEKGSCKLMHEVAIEVLGKQRSYALLSGPNFALEVAQGLPSALTVASNDVEFAQNIAEALQNSHFRAYTSSDMIGVAYGGALKNVLAIAAGTADGLGFGANTRAALITRGLHEMMRLGTHFGAQKETLMGLSGLGDLILSCTDDQSRNRRLGLALGQGQSLQQATASIGLVEGINTTHEIHKLAHQQKIEMPIVEHVFKVLHDGLDPRTAVSALLTRSVKSEAE